MWFNALIVFSGGAIGVTLRALLSTIFISANALPTTICTINIIGSFLLGALTGAVTASQNISPRLTRWKLFLGTGVLGGFTTYSALAVDSVMYAVYGRPILAVLYPIASVALGLIAAWLGYRVGVLRSPSTDHAPSRRNTNSDDNSDREILEEGASRD